MRTCGACKSLPKVCNGADMLRPYVLHDTGSMHMCGACNSLLKFCSAAGVLGGPYVLHEAGRLPGTLSTSWKPHLGQRMRVVARRRAQPGHRAVRAHTRCNGLVRGRRAQVPRPVAVRRLLRLHTELALSPTLEMLVQHCDQLGALRMRSITTLLLCSAAGLRKSAGRWRVAGACPVRRVCSSSASSTALPNACMPQMTQLASWPQSAFPSLASSRPDKQTYVRKVNVPQGSVPVSGHQERSDKTTGHHLSVSGLSVLIATHTATGHLVLGLLLAKLSEVRPEGHQAVLLQPVVSGITQERHQHCLGLGTLSHFCRCLRGAHYLQVCMQSVVTMQR